MPDRHGVTEMQYFKPMTPAEREAHERVRELRKNAPVSRADMTLIGLVFACLGLLAYAASAGWLA